MRSEDSSSIVGWVRSRGYHRRMAKPRVLHFLSASNQNFWLEDCLAALRAYVEPGVVTLAPRGPLHLRLERLGIPAWGLDGTDRKRIPIASMRLRRLLSSWRPDVLHLHQSWPSLVARVASLGRLLPTVLTRHEQPGFARLAPLPEWKRALYVRLDGLAVRWPGRLIAPSAVVEEDLVALAVEHGRIRRIPLGFDLGAIERTEAAAVVHIRDELASGGVLTAVSVGRLSWEKDHPTLLRAWPAVRDRFPEARLVVCGAGPLKKHLGDLAARLGIGSSVVLAGLRLDARQIMLASQVVVHTSLTESTGMVLIEALSLERPLVTTRVGIVGEHLLPEAHCLVVPFREPEAVSRAIIRALDEHGSSAARARAGHAAVRRVHDLEPMVRSYDEVYEEMIG